LLPPFLFSRRHDLAPEGAHGAGQGRGLRDDVVGVAGLDAGDAEDGGVHSGDIAGDDRLQCRGEVTGDHDRVDRFVRAGAVGPLAGNVDVEEGAAGKARAGARIL
jgi:hypothetical protein